MEHEVEDRIQTPWGAGRVLGHYTERGRDSETLCLIVQLDEGQLGLVKPRDVGPEQLALEVVA
jgi:hypothetical protein